MIERDPKIYAAFRVEAPALRSRLANLCKIFDAIESLACTPRDLVPKIEVLVTSGLKGASRNEISLLPGLRLICTVGTGYENVDLEAAEERGIIVVNAAGANAAAVAEHAIGLLIAIVRNLKGYDFSARNGHWQNAITPRPLLAGKTVGIAGLGNVGMRIGRIAEAMDLDVVYLARRPKVNCRWRYIPTMLEMARAVDFLVMTLPGGPETFHAVNSEVLNALGSSGYLVNVGRGSVVDTSALIDALAKGEIAGAALDVFEIEPDLPLALFDVPNLILTPHVAGVAPEVQDEAADLLYRNIKGVLGGTGPVSPVWISRPG
ncbi:NAD(P)-dependent oxidoreductase [Agrobacterium vitis]|uniref:2-hydroxyacid dehydrogenase n=1 Tax=Agrobacterium vitis TaxID=373 RepID=A0ABW9TGB9_AGRVI|nr:NAD(P)-dependent oxidoreductase [Agrobacterium vitis]MUO43035.1 2-hydroxyacid dehydrogenase [Agrobacterium vitis]